MIMYATKQTIERFKIKMPDDMHPISKAEANRIITNEHGDPLVEWGMKMFYFDHRKCIQAMNFASKFTIFLIDIKVSDFENIANLIALYLLDIYKNDSIMIKTLKKHFSNYSVCAYSKLKDRSIISSLNRNQSDFALDGYAFYDYFENNVLQTRKINHDINFKWFVSQKINGKTEYFLPGERFRKLLLDRYNRS